MNKANKIILRNKDKDVAHLFVNHRGVSCLNLQTADRQICTDLYEALSKAPSFDEIESSYLGAGALNELMKIVHGQKA